MMCFVVAYVHTAANENPAEDEGVRVTFLHGDFSMVTFAIAVCAIASGRSYAMLLESSSGYFNTWTFTGTVTWVSKHLNFKQVNFRVHALLDASEIDSLVFEP